MTADKEINASMHRIAILPLGAHEQHGPHLPFETDAIIAEGVVRRAMALVAGKLDIEMLPVEAVGYSPEHMHVAGTRTLGHAEAVERWLDIGHACLARGVSRFIMLNAHGGNSPLMTIAATEMRVRLSMLAVATSWTRFGYPDGIVSERERAIGIHGGMIETSVMLALRPDLVNMAKARDFSSAQSRFEQEFTYLRAYGPHAFGWTMADLSPVGAVGDAAAASAQAGEAILDHAAKGLAALLDDVARFDLSMLK